MTPDKDLAARLARLPKRFFSEPRHHDKGEKLLEIVYADPGNNGFYYREQKYDSVTAYVRLDLLSQLITRAEADAMVVAAWEAAARHAECAFDDRGNSRAGHHSQTDWEDGYCDGTLKAAAAIRAAQPAPAKGGE